MLSTSLLLPLPGPLGSHLGLGFRVLNPEPLNPRPPPTRAPPPPLLTPPHTHTVPPTPQVRALGALSGCLEFETQRGAFVSNPRPLLVLPCPEAVAEVRQLERNASGGCRGLGVGVGL